MAKRKNNPNNENLYQSQKIKISQIEKLTDQIKLYTFKIQSGFAASSKFHFSAGQFIMLSVPGVGEAPFAPCSDPAKTNTFQLLIRKVGLVTSALDKLKTNDLVEFRGPYGNGFPTNKLFKKDLILVAGGTGIAPIASLIKFIISRRRRFGKTYLLYGAKNPAELLLKKRYLQWQKRINFLPCVEEKDSQWSGDTGMVTELCIKVQTNPEKTIVAMAGPPLMYQFVSQKLAESRIKSEQIYVTAETRMKCGIGKCQHCTIGKHYACLDGPVFRYDEVEKNL